MDCNFINLSTQIILLIIIIINSAISQPSSTKPNIVFILADDYGHYDVGFHGSTDIPTPNIDALAYDGIILDNYYVHPICTPSRSALMTGKYDIHLGMQRSVIVGPEPYGLSTNELLMSDHLKRLEYSTHIVGKWHLGFYQPQYLPTNRGFDTHYGYYLGEEDYWTHISSDYLNYWGTDLHNDTETDRSKFGKYSADLFGEESIRLLNKHNYERNPIFLFLSFQSVHSGNSWSPLQAPYKFYKRLKHIKNKHRRMYAAMVMAMDENIGKLVQSLHQLHQLNNTIIVFSTDNGGPAAGFDWNFASNYPLRGVKNTYWEGGIRANSFIWSSQFQPRKKPRNRVSKQFMHIVDWLPTLYEAIGADPKQLKDIDGISHWKELKELMETDKRKEIIHNIDQVKSMTLSNGMKIHINTTYGPHWNGWYRTEQIESKNLIKKSLKSVENFDKLHKNLFNDHLQFVYEHSMKWQNGTSSNLSPIEIHYILEQYSTDYWLIEREPVRIICEKSTEILCDPNQQPCLHNTNRADPCEYRNLANEQPNQLIELMTKLLSYVPRIVSIRNRKPDPKSNPELHSNVWDSWENDTFCHSIN